MMLISLPYKYYTYLSVSLNVKTTLLWSPPHFLILLYIHLRLYIIHIHLSVTH